QNVNIISNNYCPINNNYNKEYLKNKFMKIFENRNSYSWYTHRILFLTIDITERSLTNIDCNINNNRMKLFFYVFIDIAIKYFSTNHNELSFDQLVDWEINPKEINDAREIQLIILSEILKFRIYQENILEKHYIRNKNLNDHEVKNILE